MLTENIPIARSIQSLERTKILILDIIQHLGKLLNMPKREKCYIMTKDMYDFMEELDLEAFTDKFAWIMVERTMFPEIPMKAFDQVN